jgi:Excalibur calcium-binding domain
MLSAATSASTSLATSTPRGSAAHSSSVRLNRAVNSRQRHIALCALVATMLLASAAGSAVDKATLSARVPVLFKNCTALNKKYPHGIGKVGARDKTSGDEPVTNFKRSTRLCRLAMSYNRRLDRDKDGIACEQA